MKDGVYFNLPEEEYHALEALSSSGLKWLAVSGADFWFNSWMNPNKTHEESIFMLLGSAYHKRILEGLEAFMTDYAYKFDGGEGYLTTADDIKERLVELGLKKTGKKSELIDRLIDADPKAKIFDVEKELYERENDGKIFLNSETIKNIEVAAAMIEKNPSLSKCFTGGYPEVSIIWTEGGIKFKSRVDYLKTMATIDLKSFSNTLKKPIDRAVISAMTNNKYYLQASFYMHAVEKAREMMLEDNYHGDVDRDWVEKFTATKDKRFLFVFQQAGPVPIAIGKEFPIGCGSHQVGNMKIEELIAKFKEYFEKFGKEMWIEQYGIDQFCDEDFPPWAWE